MKIRELKDFSPEELQDGRGKLKKELFDLRNQMVMSPLKNPLRIRYVRRMIARINTILKEFDLGIRKK